MADECRQVSGILFRLEGGWYFVDIMRVHEIIPPPELGTLVSMPPFVAGVITRHESVVPIINLRERFELPGRPPETGGRILILALPGQKAGILVDEVIGVLALSVEAIQPPPSLMNARVASFFIGLASDRERLISLVNIDMLLSPEERGALDSLAAPGREYSEEIRKPMLVGCPRCGRKYRVNDSRMSRGVMTVRCSSCCSLFRVARTGGDPGPPASGSGSGGGSLLRILIAHESPAFCDTVRSTLKGEPWEVAVCHDGRAALALLRARNVAVALLDVALPGRYGFEVCEELRSDPLLADVKVILFASIYDRTRYKRLPCTLYGADDYLEKHHIPDLLVAKIRKLLGDRNRAGKPVADGGLDQAAEGGVSTDIRETIDETRASLRHEEEVDTTVSSATDSPLPEAHVKARRLARIIASDIALYNQSAVEEGVRASTFFSLLADDIAEGRALYRRRVPEEIRSTTDYLDEAFSDLIDKVRKDLSL